MIRKANESDLAKIMTITNEIVVEMKEENNPQWHEGYPTLTDFKIDFDNNALYVYEDNEIKGFICIEKDLNDDYSHVPNSTKKEAYIMHRLGVKKENRKEGIAIKLMNYGEYLAKENNVYLMKADTEASNYKMQNLFTKLGYHQLDTFNWSDNDGTFLYYAKELTQN
ncbi:MAG: GNAT family N-acetyltransferase [Bacilli bacterium]|nr:GNAT family N-acetyltransferase [Bacilli bacterium]